MDNRNRRNDRGPQGQQVAPVEKQYDERVLAVDRVARVVKGGRRFRFRSLVIVGDKKGKVGIGIAKGADVTTATMKATEVAKKNMITVPLYKGTIPHEVEGKVAGAKLMMMPAAPGTGLIAGASVRAVLEAVGVSNIISKSFGSSNKINACYAALEALKTLKPKKDWVTTKAAAPKVKTVPAPAAEKAPAKKETTK
jgi:small subunit ribosomal protein S5